MFKRLIFLVIGIVVSGTTSACGAQRDCDLVISGLVGLVPREDNTVVVDPLIPTNAWDWFCLDNVPYHGRSLTILWDRDGEKYGKGKGFHVFAEGKEVARSDELTGIIGELP